MAGWTSLSGYLHYKPGGTSNFTLGRLKAKKRMWFALEESQCQLLYFKTEEDAGRKQPQGLINLKGAAITLDLDNQNQFIIIVDGKDHTLTAENHESMMIWLMALQAKRDHFSKRSLESEDLTLEGEEFDKRGRSSSDLSNSPQVMRSHKALCATKSLHSNMGKPLPPPPPVALASAEDLQMAPDADWKRYQLNKIGESVETSLAGRYSKEVAQRPNGQPYNRQLSVSVEHTPGMQLYLQSKRNQANACSNSSSGSTGDSDEVFGEDGQLMAPKEETWRSKILRKLNLDDDREKEKEKNQYEHTPLRRSSLSVSLSSDSAIDKGEATSPESNGRVLDLEKELIATKCELARVMNKQTCFNEILKQKDEIISDLDDKLCKVSPNDLPYDSKKRVKAVASSELHERVRVLQNQNRFLNEEVRRLAKLRGNDANRFSDQTSLVAALEGEIEKWKFDYVSLIQSSIRFSGTDSMDDAELILFGGDRHKKRVISLLENARKVNPSLPTYERLANREVHVDAYGFKHSFEDNGLLLHYLCQELSQHFITQAGSYEEHNKEWVMYLRQNSKCVFNDRGKLKHLVRGGIPDQFRKQVWRQFVHSRVQDIMTEKGPHYFRNLLNMLPDSPLAARYRKQISLDLMRTMPSNVKFATSGSRGIMDLQDVLLAFCIHSPDIGYCQGMNFIVGMALLFMDAQDAFWTLVAITERYFSSNYFDHNLVGAQADQQVLKDIVFEKLSVTAKHLDSIDIEISTVTLNWFLAVFFDAVPFMTLLRIWDCFLLEGPKVLFRFCLAILKMNEREILMKSDTISVMRHLKSCAKIAYDVEGLVKIAFEDLKPFPHRQAIKSKQAFYLTSLKEKYKRRELQKMAFAEREQMFMALEAESGSFLTFECCTTSPSGEIWLCYGEQNQSHVCRVNCKDGVMMDISMEFDTKMMSMVALPNNIVIFGSLSWLLYSYDMHKKKERWHIRLHDAVLSVCSYTDDDEQYRVFAGLADGTVAIIENAESDVVPVDVMYIPVGQSPVTCIKVLGKQLWCACGHTVYVIHAGTLDAMDNFTVSSNPYDHILSMEPSIPGVFISVRGSSILELWDPQTLNCKMLYDTRSGRYPNLRKEDDAYFNRARITSIMSYENTVWVGTGEGNLMIYDVLETGSCKTPSEQSFTGSLAENLCLVVDENDPIRKVEEKVRDLYYRKLNEGLSLSPVKQETSDAKSSTPVNISHTVDNLVVNSLGSTVYVSQADESSSACNKFLSSTPLNSPDKKLRAAQKTDAIKESESEFHSSHGSFWFDSCGDSFSHHCQHGTDTPHEAHQQDQGSKSRRRLFDQSCEEGSKDVSVESNKTVNHDTTCSSTSQDVFPENHIPSKTDLLSRYVLTQSASVQGKLLENKHEQTAQLTSSTELISSTEQKSQSFDVLDMPEKGESANSSLVIIDSEISGEGKMDNADIIKAITEANESDMSNSLTSQRNQSQSPNGDAASAVTSGFAVDSGHVSDVSDTTGTTNNISTKSANQDTIHNSNVDLNNKYSDNTCVNTDVISECNKTISNGHVDNFTSLQKQKTENTQFKSLTCDNSKSGNSDTMANSGTCDNCNNGNVCNNAKSSGVSSCSTTFEGSSRNTSTNKLSSHSGDSHLPQSTDSEVDQDEVFIDAAQSPSLSKSSLAVDDQQEEPKTPTRKSPGPVYFPDNVNSGSESSAYSMKSAREQLTPNTSSVASNLSDRSRLDSSSSKPTNFKPKNREAQYRIDFTNIQVDTDVESNVSFSLHGSLCSEADFKQFEEFKQKNGLSGIDPASLIFPEDFNISSLDNTEEKLMQLYNNSGCFGTPKSTHTWSSYDEISTPSRADVESVSAKNTRPSMIRVNSIQSNISAATSIISATTMSESLYTADLYLQAKVKISDKPVKCLLKDLSEGEPIMFSMSGSYGDDEAVLKWKKEENEMMWTNEPVLEICPHTKVAKLPNYMRRLSLMSSSDNSSIASFKKMNLSQ